MGANQTLEHVRDPHNHKELYESWKKKGMVFKRINKANSKLVREYLKDMEIGQNVNPSSRKGPRSQGRLRNNKAKLNTIISHYEIKFNKKDISKATDTELLNLFKQWKEGKLKSFRTNMKLTSAGTYVKVFKAFWHWYQRRERKNQNIIPDITVDLDATEEKPKFNYFTIEQLKKICDRAKFEYKVVMMFMFDSGIRSPTELLNVKVNDLQNDKGKYTLDIREETSKTFGRKIKLLLCSDILKEYLTSAKLKQDDYLFKYQSPKVINEYLQRLGFKYLGIGKETIGKSGRVWIKDGLTMYDFRHSSCCYWLPRYKSESALKYRFGWKKSDMIYYYSEFLGMRDTIQEEDLYVDITKTELEKQLEHEKQQRELLEIQVKELKREQGKMREGLVKVLNKLNITEKLVKSKKEGRKLSKRAISKLERNPRYAITTRKKKKS